MGAPYLCELYIQEPHQVLKVKIRERYLCGSTQGKKSIIIVKYTKNILHNTLQKKIQRILLCQQIWFLVKTHFPVHRPPSSHFVLTWQEGLRKLSGLMFIRALILFMRAQPSWPNNLPKAPPSNTITMGNRFHHMNLWGSRGMKTFILQQQEMLKEVFFTPNFLLNSQI